MRLSHKAMGLVLALSLGVTACSDEQPTFKVTGTCTSKAGVLIGEGSGFTPNGKYITSVIAPDGQVYPVPDPEGTASKDGTTPNWKWPCFYEGKGDAPGIYKVTITDRTTNKTASATFEVKQP
jgi:hypothetical protein